MASIKAGRYHGVFRFFSFESIFLLLLLNYRYWFIDPFKLSQLISWLCLIASIAIASLGFYLLNAAGKPKGEMENTTKLISIGLYKTIRHPLYLSLILLGAGVFFKHIDGAQSALLAVNLVSIVLTAKTEEKELIRKFGNRYRRYMARTRMLIPFIF